MAKQSSPCSHWQLDCIIWPLKLKHCKAVDYNSTFQLDCFLDSDQSAVQWTDGSALQRLHCSDLLDAVQCSTVGGRNTNDAELNLQPDLLIKCRSLCLRYKSPPTTVCVHSGPVWCACTGVVSQVVVTIIILSPRKWKETAVWPQIRELRRVPLDR